MDQEGAQKKLLWRCRRGTKELDILLSRFVREQYSGLDQPARDDFDRLLETQDPVLTEWLCFDGIPPSEFEAIVARIREITG